MLLVLNLNVFTSVGYVVNVDGWFGNQFLLVFSCLLVYNLVRLDGVRKGILRNQAEPDQTRLGFFQPASPTDTITMMMMMMWPFSRMFFLFILTCPL